MPAAIYRPPPLIRPIRRSMNLIPQLELGPNLAGNPSVEIDLNHWTGAKTTRVNTDALDGSWSAQVGPEAVAFNYDNYFSASTMYSNGISVTTGEIYVFTIWVKQPAAYPMDLNARIYDAAFSATVFDTPMKPTSEVINGWVKWTSNPVVIPAGYIYPTMEGSPHTTTHNTLFDLVELHKIAVPAGPEPPVTNVAPPVLTFVA